MSAPVSYSMAEAKSAVCQTHATVTGMAWLTLYTLVPKNTAIASVDAVLPIKLVGASIAKHKLTLNGCMHVRRGT